MRLFVTRTYSDGILDSRGYRLRFLVENFVCAAAAPTALAVGTLLIGGGVGSIVVAFVGGLLALTIATSVRTTRGAALGGVLITAAIVLFLVVVDWLFSHPILPE